MAVIIAYKDPEGKGEDQDNTSAVDALGEYSNSEYHHAPHFHNLSMQLYCGRYCDDVHTFDT